MMEISWAVAKNWDHYIRNFVRKNICKEGKENEGRKEGKQGLNEWRKDNRSIWMFNFEITVIKWFWFRTVYINTGMWTFLYHFPKLILSLVVTFANTFLSIASSGCTRGGICPQNCLAPQLWVKSRKNEHFPVQTKVVKTDDFLRVFPRSGQNWWLYESCPPPPPHLHIKKCLSRNFFWCWRHHVCSQLCVIWVLMFVFISEHKPTEVPNLWAPKKKKMIK